MGERSPRYLSLAGLPWTARLAAIGCIVAWIMAAAYVFAYGLSIDVPGGSLAISNFGKVPKAVPPIVYLGLAMAAAALTIASFSPGWRMRQLTRVGIALVGLTFATAPLGVAQSLEGIEHARDITPVKLRSDLEKKLQRKVSDAEFQLAYEVNRQRLELVNESREGQLRVAPEWVPGLVRLCGWFGLVAAIVGAIPARLARRFAWAPVLAAAAATIPYLAGLLVYSLLLAVGEPPVLAAGLSVATMIVIAGSIALFVPVILLWQAVVGARAARDLGSGALRTLDRLPMALAVFLAIKVTWLGLGYSGLLPPLLGGDNAALEGSAHDDLLSWGIATAAAAAAAFWLAKRCELRASERELGLTAAAIVAAFIAPLVVAAACLLGAGALSSLTLDSGGFHTLSTLADWFSRRILVAQVLSIYGAVVIGAILWWRRGPSAVAALLLLFGLLGLSRAVGITAAWGSPRGAPGWYDLATLDTMITVAVIFLLVGPWRRSRLVTDAGLTAVVVCSTVMAYAGTVVSGFWHGGAFYLALLLPVLYGVTLGARRLNRAERHRVAPVLAFLGAATGLLAVMVIQLTIGFAGPGIVTEGDVGRLLLAPPLAAVLVAALCAGLRERPAGEASSRPA